MDSSSKAAVQMVPCCLRLTTCEWVASRNTGIHVNILAASLHRPRLRQPSRPSVCTPLAVMQMAQCFLRLITWVLVASRNTCVHVHSATSSLHWLRVGNRQRLRCVFLSGSSSGRSVLATTTRSPNISCDMSAHFVDSILSASNSERCFESSSVINWKSVAPLSKFLYWF